MRIPIKIGIIESYIIASVRLNIDIPFIPNFGIKAKQQDRQIKVKVLDRLIEWCNDEKHELKRKK